MWVEEWGPAQPVPFGPFNDTNDHEIARGRYKLDGISARNAGSAAVTVRVTDGASDNALDLIDLQVPAGEAANAAVGTSGATCERSLTVSLSAAESTTGTLLVRLPRR